MDVRKPTYYQELLKDAIDSAMSYREFRELVSELAKNNGTTGPEQSQAYKNYTTLNDRRMKRWDKTLRISDDHLDVIEHFDQKVYWLVITESWCGDAAPSLPVMNKIAEANENIELRIILRSDSPEVMDLFLTDGKQSIPKLVVLDQDYKAISTWGPLPTKAAEIAAVYKAEHGLLTAEFKEELQHWFNADKGKDVLRDLMELLTLKEVGDRS